MFSISSNSCGIQELAHSAVSTYPTSTTEVGSTTKSVCISLQGIDEGKEVSITVATCSNFSFWDNVVPEGR